MDLDLYLQVMNMDYAEIDGWKNGNKVLVYMNLNLCWDGYLVR